MFEAQPIHQAERKEFNDYVSLALQAREKRDDYQWLLGDIANEVRVFYGDDSIGKLACEIGVKKSSLMTYRVVSRTFGPGKRITEIPFTLHQICAYTDKPEEWLHKAADNNFTCDKLVYEIKQSKGESVRPQNEEKIKLAAEWLKNTVNSFEEDITAQQAKNIVEKIASILKGR